MNSKKEKTQRQRVSVNVNDGGVAEGEKAKPIAKENKSYKDRDAREEKMARYEFVEGWPKWLLDNIPANVLANIVPKSADSYEKLAKVRNIIPS